jgi:hypothetical protein
LPAALFDNPEETGCFVITAGNRHFIFLRKTGIVAGTHPVPVCKFVRGHGNVYPRRNHNAGE